jgi:hypothetical protein
MSDFIEPQTKHQSVPIFQENRIVGTARIALGVVKQLEKLMEQKYSD